MTKLIGSAPNLEMLKDAIKKQWYASKVELVTDRQGKTRVSVNDKVTFLDLIIKTKGKRVRLEREV